MSCKFTELESEMSTESVARSDETYARLKARMDLAQKDQGQAREGLAKLASSSPPEVARTKS